jgi:LPS sulfotransferase NodH
MEYTNIHTMKGLIQRLGKGDLDAYWKELKRRRTSPNGVFGYKLFVTTFHWIAKNAPELLPHIAPDHVVYFTRADKVAQAVSYARAIQTEAWFAGVNEHKDPSYNFEQIQSCEDSIRRQEAEWEHIFAVTSNSPLRIDYDELRNDPNSNLRRVCQKLGVVFDGRVERTVPEIEKQSDGTSREWIEQYKNELIERGTERPSTEIVAP